MRISNLMERQVLRIDEDSTVQRAAEVMGEKHVGSLLVTRGYEDVGIITERDVLSRVIAKKRSLDEVKVKEVMSHPVITVEKDSNGETVLKTMYEQRVRRVFVTEEGKIVGIFSTSDIT
ncbi:CBS domain-containing protein, partial [Candidatus Bathyarchaeota archaeon]|nr:CBS domain-containing protein [Candidatus Bathyarchaeota archaeon]